MTVIPRSVAQSSAYNLAGLGWPQNVNQRQDLGFFQALLAIGQQGLQTAATAITSKAQAKVIGAQTRLEDVRARAAEIAAKNRIVTIGVLAALAVGGIVVLTRRK